MAKTYNNRSSIVQSSTIGALHFLRKLAPPEMVIHVGAGAGTGDMSQWMQWDVPNAWIIDANAERLQWAQALIAGHPNWHVVSDVLADEAGETRFYEATNPDEDGLVAPEQLHSIWPNLRSIAQDQRNTKRLEQLVTSAGGGATTGTCWLLIDCLPALSVLKGAGSCLESCSVVWVRTLLKPLAETEKDASLAALEAFLQPLGFRCLEITESNHPALGYAVFVRDFHAVLQPRIEALTHASTALEQEKLALGTRHGELQQDFISLTLRYEQQAKLVSDNQITIDHLSSEQASLVQALQQQLVELSGFKTTLEQERTVLASRQAELTQELNTLSSQQTSLVAEQQAERAQLAQAREEQARLADERLQQIDDCKSQLEQLAKARDEDISLANERLEQIEALNQINATLVQAKSELELQREQLHDAIATLNQQIEQLAAAHSNQTILANDLKNQIAQLLPTHEEHARLIADYQQRLSALDQTRSALELEMAASTTLNVSLQEQVNSLVNARNEQVMLTDQLKNELGQIQSLLHHREIRISQLEHEIADRNTRQQIINDDVTRAEAQIDLIKDVLFRESSL